MDYDALRYFADSWGLMALFAVFVGIVLWVYRRGSRKQYDEHAEIPFKRD